MDLINSRIIAELKTNSRISWDDLSEIVGISRPSLMKRVDRLERINVIKGYTILTSHSNSSESPNEKKILSFLRIKFSKGSDCFQLSKVFPTYENIISSWAVTGEWDCIVLVQANSMEKISEIREIIVHTGGIEEIETEVVLNDLL